MIDENNEIEVEEVLIETKRPIVLIDSGMGGLNILNKLKELYPVENFIYICDNEFLPLGNKNIKVLNRRINKMIKKIKELNPKSILLACNTIDSISGDVFDSAFAYLDVYHVIKPSMEKAMELTKDKNIAILGTKNTIESQAHMKYALLKKNLNIYGVECIDLASAIEKNENVKEVLTKEISVLNEVDFDTLILGCTHYSKVKASIKKMFKDIKIIDSSEVLIENYNENHNKFLDNKADKQKIEIYITEDSDLIKENVKKIIGDNVDIKKIDM